MRLAEDITDRGLTRTETRSGTLPQKAAEVELARLKSLLLSDERRDLAGIEKRIAVVERFHTDLDERSRKVAEVIAPALEHAAEVRPQAVASALGPAITQGIRHEMIASRDEMVAALHPLAGRLVAAAVSDAFGRLAEEVNRRVERLFSWRGLTLGIKARLTGTSVSALILNDLRKTELRRVYLFERHSNDIAFLWPNEDHRAQTVVEAVDKINNAVALMSDLEADRTPLPLRALTLGDREIAVQHSATHVVAIETRGHLSDRRKADLNEAALSLLDYATRNPTESDARLTAAAMTAFAKRIRKLEHDGNGRSRGGPALAIFVALLLSLAGYLGWRTWEGYRLSQQAAAVEAALSHDFADGSAAFRVEMDRGSRLISVSGVAFGAADPREIAARLRRIAAPFALDFDAAIRDVDAERRSRTLLESELAETRRRLGATTAALAALERRIADVPEPSASDRLDRWISRNAVFFADGAAFRDADRAGAKLDSLAALLSDVPQARLGVTGHTDSIGARDANVRIANARVAAVIDALVGRGISRERLMPLGIGVGTDLTGVESGLDSPNRRVDFSLVFSAE